ncbi:hypothetical protein F518_03571 [Serratia marcescens VGH107]|nr:hypothetical protein F518_03571 [Serratia marcescens VGH107]
MIPSLSEFFAAKGEEATDQEKNKGAGGVACQYLVFRTGMVLRIALRKARGAMNAAIMRMNIFDTSELWAVISVRRPGDEQ